MQCTENYTNFLSISTLKSQQHFQLHIKEKLKTALLKKSFYAIIKIKNIKEVINVSNENILIGKNAVLEALKAGRHIDSIWLSCEKQNANMKQIIEIAEKNKINIKKCTHHKLESISKNTNHQGIIAIAKAYQYTDVDTILSNANTKGEPPFIIIADGIEDTHNLGAIIRSAECAGAHGVIIPQRHSAQINQTVSKTSAGAIEHILIARVKNIAQEIKKLQKKSVWVYGLESGGKSWSTCDFTAATALVIGSEGKGISRLVTEYCDEIVSLPLLGSISSLNASVAGGIVMYEVVRQRKSK